MALGRPAGIAFINLLLVVASADASIWNSYSSPQDYSHQTQEMHKAVGRKMHKLQGLTEAIVVNADGNWTVPFLHSHMSARKPLLRHHPPRSLEQEKSLRSNQHAFEVYGKNSNSDIYRAPQSSGAWVQVQGKLHTVSVGKDMVWGTNTNHHIYKCTQPCNGSWTQVAGSLVQVDAGVTEVWGVNVDHDIYRGSLHNSGQWSQVDGKLKWVSVGKGWVWGVNVHHNIFKCSLAHCVWTQIPGALKQIDAGETEVWGVSAANLIFKGRSEYTFTEPLRL